MSSKTIVAYIARPIGGDVEANLASLREVIKNINHTEPFTVPFCPYYADVVSCGDDEINRARGLKNGLAVLSRTGMVDELRLYGSHISSGMKVEIKTAVLIGIPIACATSALHEQLGPVLKELQISLIGRA